MFSALDPYPYGAGALAITTLCCLLIMLVASEMAMPAGLFLPTVCWGGAFGSMFGLGSQYVVRTLWGEEEAQMIAPGTYALVGCTAGLAGVFHSNISLVVIILEVRRGPDSSVCLACDLSPRLQDPSSLSSEPKPLIFCCQGTGNANFLIPNLLSVVVANIVGSRLTRSLYHQQVLPCYQHGHTCPILPKDLLSVFLGFRHQLSVFLGCRHPSRGWGKC